LRSTKGSQASAASSAGIRRTLANIAMDLGYDRLNWATRGASWSVNALCRDQGMIMLETPGNDRSECVGELRALGCSDRRGANPRESELGRFCTEARGSRHLLIVFPLVGSLDATLPASARSGLGQAPLLGGASSEAAGRCGLGRWPEPPGGSTSRLGSGSAAEDLPSLLAVNRFGRQNHTANVAAAWQPLGPVLAPNLATGAGTIDGVCRSGHPVPWSLAAGHRGRGVVSHGHARRFQVTSSGSPAA